VSLDERWEENGRSALTDSTQHHIELPNSKIPRDSDLYVEGSTNWSSNSSEPSAEGHFFMREVAGNYEFFR
jgi:hypothetical protein